MSFGRITRAIIETLHVSVPTVFDSARGALTPELCDLRLDSWSKKLLDQARVTLHVQGLEKAEQDAVFIVMSNHQSLYDIPVLFQALQRRVRMVAKKELFQIPVWAQAMRSAGFIELDRQDRFRAIQSLAAAEEALTAKTSIWIAPEGTRSATGELGPFKKGGFHLAQSTGMSILPVTIDGTRHVLPARGWSVHSGAAVRVTIHDPIDPKRYSREQLSDLMAQVRAAIASALPHGN
jgi:1-acyl-sn-glycerol-3-phosphate acyltransferase